ncbi:MAG: hypothetical protein Q9227_003081 [Pyrenula ochraceoflavens]
MTDNLSPFSHYFGWTGPGLTIDTACSASAVAIHQACKAILGGECTAALAGGVAIMGNIIWFQNLAGASFLSPTGQCKPWDDAADGYCRGEAIGCVFLKKRSAAIADGNQILGCIASSAVYQNENCTPVFVPNSPSLSSLFKDVVNKARLEPRQISVVEAHGTGTPVGDPAEYESIRRALAGPLRENLLSIGSVKGFVGHTEGASGVISLIKTIMMMQEGMIPQQASFQSLSHHIRASASDMIEIPIQLKPWSSSFKAALINNYGASGSNASMIVTQPPHPSQDGIGSSTLHGTNVKHPFWICGLDDRSLRDYCVRLLNLTRTKNVSAKKISVANLSFNICRQSNRSLDRGFMFCCTTLKEFENKVDAFASGDKSISSHPAKQQALPVIMCFGGQITNFIGLDRKVFDSIKILRSYLDQCNAVFLSIGLDGIYPDIFQREPIEDQCKLQTMLFAIQYASAKSWIDCGVQIAAAVGHSFGELTALCVSGVLSLKDTAKMIAGRAKLVRDSWGQDRGAMMAIEADLQVVEKVLSDSRKKLPDGTQATIACFNGPRSFTLAGSTKGIDAIAQTIAESKIYSSSTRTKRLSVTNAFHSALVEPLLEELEEIGSKLTFREASISLERSTEEPFVDEMSPSFVAEHMRYPVYFDHAVQRLARQYPTAIWLEAGSNSTITTMASRALGFPAGNHFQAVNITSDNAMQNLADTTLALWKAGSTVVYWPHHTLQTYDYGYIFLPPYQFEKSRHWMELKKPQKEVATSVEETPKPQAEQETPTGLWTFVSYEDSMQRRARFRVNTMTKEYESFISGHWIAQTAPICPATLEVDIAIEALKSIRPDLAAPEMQPILQDMENHSPICVDPSRSVWLDYEALDDSCQSWHWSIVSTGSAQKAGTSTQHVHGKLIFRSADNPQYRAEFERFERLKSHESCLRVLNSDNIDSDIIQGRHIYKAFSEIVDYGEEYRGLKKLVGLRNKCAGRVRKKHIGKTWLDVHLSDTFSQVGGIWVNCMTNRPPEEMFIAGGCELLMRSPKFRADAFHALPESWDVLAYHHQESESAYKTDVFTFDSTSSEMMEVMLGIKYARVATASMQKILARLSPGVAKTTHNAASVRVSLDPAARTSSVPAPEAPNVALKATSPQELKNDTQKPQQDSKPDIKSAARALLADISGLAPHEITDDMALADIGIDSLMSMELASEVESIFKCELPMEKLMEVIDFLSFVDCVRSCLGLADDDDNDETDSDNDVSSEKSSQANILSKSSDADVPESPPSSVDADEPISDTKGSFETVLLNATTQAEVRGRTNASTNGHNQTDPNAVAGIPKMNGISPYTNGDLPHSFSKRIKDVGSGNLEIPASAVLEAFGEVKLRTDQMIREFKIDNFAETICPKSTQLCIALTLEAFENLGLSIKGAKAGETLPRIQYAPQHQRLIEYLYGMLEQEARLIDTSGDVVKRTAISPPSKSSRALLQDLLRLYPDWSYAMKLTHFAGGRLTDVLTDKTDGIKIIFGSEEGKELVGGLYCEHVFNRMNYTQMSDFVESLIARLPMQDGPLKILEMGAGTGGTTLFMAPLLARLGVSVEYTFTDLSASMVAAAKKKFAEYSFMKFQTHDIEREVPVDLLGTQHILIASNAVHATHDLVKSSINIRNALRPDGVLMMLEMTKIVPFVDVIFGLLEGWWLFDDGRKHAIANQDRWEKDLKAAGFGHVDYSDGYLPENKIQKVIIALASGPSYPRLPIPEPSAPKNEMTDLDTRERDISTFCQKYGAAFIAPTATPISKSLQQGDSHNVLITGASGNLGTQLVKAFSERSDVRSVICLNRKSNSDPLKRQKEACATRGVAMDEDALRKLQVLETDTRKPHLGISKAQYALLVENVDTIVHNAWPMSGKRTVKGLEGQFQAMRNLIDLAREIACNKPEAFKVSFQLISSIGVVGHYPLWSGVTRVPEKRMEVRSVLPNGYCDAKFTCERMLDDTLHKFPNRFRTMTARLGQVAGSSVSGYWNPMEHFPFLIKSAKSLRMMPDLPGVLSWCPVDYMATALSELVLDNQHVQPQAIYHIDNPRQQPWSEMVATLADALDVPSTNIIPFADWVNKVKCSPLSSETDNPAAKLIDFLADHFQRMSCGGLILDTSKACENSKTLAAMGPISAETARRYVKAWEDMGFLY